MTIVDNNAVVARAFLGNAITEIKFDNDNSWTGFNAVEFLLDDGTVVTMEAVGKHDEGFGLSIIVNSPQDMKGRIYRL